MAIRERLAAQDPDNAKRQRDLSFSHNRIGGVLEAQDDLAAALAEFRKDLAIAERLAALDPDNVRWQDDLAYSLYKTGVIHEALGEFSEAAQLWRCELRAREALSIHEEDPCTVADSLAACHHQIGNACEAAADHEGAMAAFQEYLRLRIQILEVRPTDASARRNVAIGQASVARSQLARGALEPAEEVLLPAMATLRELIDPEDPGTRIDYAAVIALVAEIAQRSGRQEDLMRHRAELSDFDLQTDDVEGRFRKRSLPLILKHTKHTL